ncbi:MAG: hypothetical protein QHH00_04180 [Methanomassiliicoccales archaeon]|jgi:thymidylate kinase|nr:hypothetical protein [Methanomassiliicoccales archaeon]
MKPRLICIIGPDGTGKTTQAKLLVEKLRKKEVDCDYKWMRFHHFFSLPVLALARLMGLSEVKTSKNGRIIGYHYFYKSKMISKLYTGLLFLDTLSFTMMKVYIPMKLLKKTVVCDRFIHDTLIDLAVSTGDKSVYNSKMGKLFIKLIPEDAKTFMLITDEDVLRERREDVMEDKTLEIKIDLYMRLAQQFKITMMEANLPIEEIQNTLLRAIE